MNGRILIVDDEKKIRLIMGQILRDEGCEIAEAESGERAVEIADEVDPEVIIMDQNMPGMNGIEALGAIRERRPEQTAIILTAYGSIPLAVEAIKNGAWDYLTKPFDNEELLLVIGRALEHSRLAGEVARLKRELRDKYRFENIIGASPAMQNLFEQMNRVCDTDATVLIQGASGTGKELVARAIHYHSGRRDKPLVSVNCGAIPVNLLESEFFGHEKGAFTDARERKTGKFEQAQGGTLFLDEVGELPPDSQVKLLRVLEDRTITRVGGKYEIPVDVRIIAATNKHLEEEVDRGGFRLDLLYRLNVFTLTLPTLAEREGDIPLLAGNFIDKYNRRLDLTVTSVSLSAMQALEGYSWPGNVRDIENAVQSAMILRRDGVIELDDLPLRLRGYPDEPAADDPEELGLERYIGDMCARLEKRVILRTLEKYGHNRTATAEALGISRKTLFNKMKQYGI